MQGGDEGDGVNVVGGAAPGEVIDGLGEALEKGSVRGGPRETFDEFVADVAAAKVREDQGVGTTGDARAGGFAPNETEPGG